MNYMKQVVQMLGVEMNEPFKISVNYDYLREYQGFYSNYSEYFRITEEKFETTFSLSYGEWFDDNYFELGVFNTWGIFSNILMGNIKVVKIKQDNLSLNEKKLINDAIKELRETASNLKPDEKDWEIQIEKYEISSKKTKVEFKIYDSDGIDIACKTIIAKNNEFMGLFENVPYCPEDLVL